MRPAALIPGLGRCERGCGQVCQEQYTEAGPAVGRSLTGPVSSWIGTNLIIVGERHQPTCVTVIVVHVVAGDNDGNDNDGGDNDGSGDGDA